MSEASKRQSSGPQGNNLFSKLSDVVNPLYAFAIITAGLVTPFMAPALTPVVTYFFFSICTPFLLSNLLSFLRRFSLLLSYLTFYFTALILF